MKLKHTLNKDLQKKQKIQNQLCKKLLDKGILNSKINFSFEIIKRALDLGLKSMVSVSLGKDSTVMLDLIRQINQDIPAIIFTCDETKSMYNFLDLIEKYKKTHKLIERNIQSYLDVHQSTYKYFKSHVDREFKVSFIGLRREESQKRSWQIKKYGYMHKDQDGHIDVYPIANWTVQDIEIYIRGKGLPYNDKYQLFGFKDRVMGRVRDELEAEKLKIYKNNYATTTNNS